MVRDSRLFARIDLDYADHPKIAGLSDAAFRAHVEMILYSRRYQLDGRVAKRVAKRWLKGSLDELLTNDDEAPSLYELPNGDYMIHGYADMQETRSEIEAKRERNAANGSKGGSAKQRTAKRVASQSPSEPLSESLASRSTSSQAEEEEEEEEDIYSSSGDERSQSKTRFDEFYAAYPKKVAKKKAQTKFATAVKQGTDPQTIIAGAKRYATEVAHTDSKFIKQPDGWLEAGRWDDEPVEEAKPPRSLWDLRNG